MNLKLFRFNLLSENCYVVWKDGGDRAAVIDPGAFSRAESEELLGFLRGRSLVPDAILLTHAHPDHTAGVRSILDNFDIPVYMSGEDKVIFDGGFPTVDIADGDILRVAGYDFKVIATPGHTPGCVCFHEVSEKALFTGDTLFAGTIGRTDLAYGDYDREIVSIMEKLIWLDPETEIYPGHGPSSDIGYERANNPMLEPFNEKEESEDLSPDEFPHY